MPNFEALREHMVVRHLAGRDIADAAVLEAFRSVPREAFVPPAFAAAAYDDRPLPIGAGQTISQPYIVALMIQAAAIGRHANVLEVGAGSGYAAALLGRLARQVTAVERYRDLALDAAARLARLGITNVSVIEGDGTLGFPEQSPFDAILVAAAGPEPPPPLLEQLASGGRLVMPVDAGPGGQRLVVIRRGENGQFERRELCAVRFVPLVGAHGIEPG